MDKQFVFSHGYLINRAHITYAQLLSAPTINQVKLNFRDGVTLTIKAEDEQDAISTMKLLEFGKQ